MVANVVESKLVELAGETPAPRAQLPLPPSERDFELYGLVVVEGASTRAAAQAFGLSQTRVIQIRDRVAEWIASEVPPLARATPAQRLALAADIARNRFDFLYSQAMDAWRGSKGPQTVTRSGASGELTSTRDSQGDPRYIMLAVRITERTVGLGAAIEKATANRGQGTGDAGPESQSPPVGDCSVSAATHESQPQVEPTAVAVSEVAPIVSDENKRRRRVFFGGPDGVFEDCSAEPKANRGSAAGATIPR
jgi:hypothetical protein